jgi:extracellular factor (EF) 3-hydroxypalmitic acid methyl ester biosynthesis protein
MTVVAVAQAEHSQKPSNKLRALRHKASEFGVGPIACTAWHPVFQVMSGVVENLSMSGLLVRFPSTRSAGQIEVDDWILSVRVFLSTGEVICHSDTAVRHAAVEGDDWLVGLQLKKGVVDLPTLFERQTRCHFASRCDQAERVADASKILPQFKEWVADLRNYLDRMRTFLEQEEAALESEDLFTRDQIVSQYLAEVAPRIVSRVQTASHQMGPMLSGLSDEEHATHRAYAQLHLGAFFSQSPFIRRAQKKPLGYAGDYEMMNMLYRPAHQDGCGLFGRVLNICATTEVAARANINRITYLQEKIRCIVQLFSNNNSGKIRIASVGSGPAKELEDLLEKEPQFGKYLDIMLIDQDSRAISYCERKFAQIAQNTGAQFHFVRESIKKLLCGGRLGLTIDSRHLIYSAGLFDYLSDRSFVALLSTLYDGVIEGGQLLVGNVNVTNPTRYFMEYFAEWFLIHRSPNQLRDCAKLLRPAPRQIRVESEPLGVNLFLALEK